MRTLRHLLISALLAAAVLVCRHDADSPQARLRRLARTLRAASPGASLAPSVIARKLHTLGAPALGLGLELLRQRDPSVRAAAAGYLGQQRSALAVAGLIRLLRDPEPRVRCAAARALGQIADRRALWFLRRAMASDDLTVATAALEAAQRIQARAASQHDG